MLSKYYVIPFALAALFRDAIDEANPERQLVIVERNDPRRPTDVTDQAGSMLYEKCFIMKEALPAEQHELAMSYASEGVLCFETAAECAAFFAPIYDDTASFPVLISSTQTD